MDSSCGDFAASKAEAENRFKKYKSLDPFPNIKQTLLSSADIQAYIAATGMIHPFKNKTIAQASITMTIGPEVLFWNQENNQKYRQDYSENEEIILRANSITFLRTAERFQVPDYIAVRFNFRIKHVHRGLLLGTGPLIDPGFVGYPMIPVHNLTDDEYRVYVGEEFINVEFTKISDINNDSQKSIDGKIYSFKYIENTAKTPDFSFMKNIKKNVPNNKVKSSLSGVLDEATKLVKDQEKQLKRQFRWTLITIIIALVALAFAGYTLTLQSMDIINAAREKIEENKSTNEEIKKLAERIRILENKLK